MTSKERPLAAFEHRETDKLSVPSVGLSSEIPSAAHIKQEYEEWLRARVRGHHSGVEE